jgi:hypothetical protein
MKTPIAKVLQFGVALAFMAALLVAPPSAHANPSVKGPKTYAEADKDGSTTAYILGFEVKEKDKNGKITQWYQSFKDSDGKEVLYIARVVPGLENHPPYESIQLITTYIYNKDRNVSEEFEFYGDGTLRHHTLHKYTIDGKWIEGDEYDATGKLIARELTPPQAHLYGTPGGGI